VSEADYTHWTTDTIRFSDQDAVGHVNNVAVAAYVESGRVGFGTSLRGAHDPGASFILAHLAIDYRAQAHYPGTIRIGTRLAKLGRTSFTTEHGVFKDDECIATATCVLVHVRDGRPAPIEGELKSAMDELLTPGGGDLPR
jgi:acyl-CoA thioester hydrolase